MNGKRRFLSIFMAGLFALFSACMPADFQGSSAGEPGPEAVAASTEPGSIAAGERLFVDNCAACHASQSEAPMALSGVTQRMGRSDFSLLLDQGRELMPARPDLSSRDREDLWAFLATDAVARVEVAGGGCGCAARLRAAAGPIGQKEVAEARADCGAGCCSSGSCGALGVSAGACGAN